MVKEGVGAGVATVEILLEKLATVGDPLSQYQQRSGLTSGCDIGISRIRPESASRFFPTLSLGCVYKENERKIWDQTVYAFQQRSASRYHA